MLAGLLQVLATCKDRDAIGAVSHCVRLRSGEFSPAEHFLGMALVRQQKLLSFTAGLAVAGASYVSTQVIVYL